jgi:hypothetical protein
MIKAYQVVPRVHCFTNRLRICNYRTCTTERVLPQLRGLLPASHRGSPGSIPSQIVCDLWWTKWQWDRFSMSTSIYPTSSHSAKYSIIRGWYKRPTTSGRRAKWTHVSLTPHHQLKKYPAVPFIYRSFRFEHTTIHSYSSQDKHKAPVCRHRTLSPANILTSFVFCLLFELRPRLFPFPSSERPPPLLPWWFQSNEPLSTDPFPFLEYVKHIHTLYTWSSTYDLCDLRPAILMTTKT